MDRKAASAAAHAALAVIHNAGNPKWATYARPYLDVIANDNYGHDDPEAVVLYALSNLANWRGEIARTTKTQLRAAIKKV